MSEKSSPEDPADRTTRNEASSLDGEGTPSTAKTAPTSILGPDGPLATSDRREAHDAEPLVLSPGDTLADRYTVLQTIGEGGMGVVLAAYDARLDRRVALKLLHPDAGRDTAALQTRMIREAHAMTRLNDPHVVHVYDAGALPGGGIFICMEFVEGQTLSAWVKEKPRPFREVLRGFVDAGKGLAAAHAAGIIHRDFKPDNVLVGRDGRVRVTDFGVASTGGMGQPVPTPGSLKSGEAWERLLTVPGTVVGTPKYMSPEMLHGEPGSVQSDIYAFCLSLYEALYRQSPFPGDTPAERVKARKEGRLAPPPASTEVPAWVGRVVLRGLDRDPEKRPSSIRDLIAALEDDPAARRRARLRAGAISVVMALLAGLALWGRFGQVKE